MSFKDINSAFQIVPRQFEVLTVLFNFSTFFVISLPILTLKAGYWFCHFLVIAYYLPYRNSLPVAAAHFRFQSTVSPVLINVMC